MSREEIVVWLDTMAHRYERFLPKHVVFFFCRRVEKLGSDTSGTQATPSPVR